MQRIPQIARLALGGRATYCTHISRTVKIGEGVFKYEGPSKPFAKMSEADFYKHEDFHTFWNSIGLEVYLPENPSEPLPETPLEPKQQFSESKQQAQHQQQQPPPSSSENSSNLPSIYPGMEHLEIHATPQRLRLADQEKHREAEEHS
eukprot:Sspe_Gene.66004::Locus_39022_Transcript_1_1_Confidence_1.000_Length_694::g.66004::m.66004